MHREFRKLLRSAGGVSRWVVAVNLDVRDFSTFTGPRMESVEAALFLKVVYEKLLSSEYFAGAHFFKSTGDGLLIVYEHDENRLAETLEDATARSIRAVEDFPKICDDEPMVNFEVPKDLGVGIAHGAASRLEAKDKVLDYFGKPLNLASRLMDLARPKGIVIDDTAPLAPATRRRFSSEEVYVRGIAEQEPMAVYSWRKHTRIPPDARIPMLEPDWRSMPSKSMKMSRLQELAEGSTAVTFTLPQRPFADEVSLKLEYPSVTRGGRRGAGLIRTLEQDKHYTLVQDRGQTVVRIRTGDVAEELDGDGVKASWDLRFTLAYPVLPT
jgi:class 3 adenylate cyclase